MIEKLYVPDRDDWRAWLRENFAAKSEVWLIYHKKHTGKPSIPYDDSVEEALCFGWIDGVIRRIDDEKCARKFTPRKDRSRWSESNKNRAEKMINEGKMTAAGLAKIEEAKKNGEWFKPRQVRRELVIPTFIEEALANNRKAQVNFNKLANSYKRMYVGWISSAKKEETRIRRLVEAVSLLQQNKKLGLK